MDKYLIQIKLKGYDHKVLDAQTKRIVTAVEDTNATIVGPIPLPTDKEVITVLRSPHVNKTSREQFERRTHKRLILVKDYSIATLDVLGKLQLPSGIDTSISNKSIANKGK